MLFLYIVVALLLVAGLLGSILPFIPGTPLILAGAVLYAAATEFDPVGPWHLALLVAISVFAYSLDYLAGALGVQKLGGSRWSMLGAVLGAIVGLFFGPFGLVLGLILGAVAVEFIVSRKLRTSLRSGLGTVVGMILGMAIKLSLAVVMVGLFLWWAASG